MSNFDRYGSPKSDFLIGVDGEVAFDRGMNREGRRGMRSQEESLRYEYDRLRAEFEQQARQMKQAGDKINELSSFIDDQAQPVRVFGAVISAAGGGKFVLIGTAQGQIIGRIPKGAAAPRHGEIVIVDSKSGAIENTVSGMALTGDIARVVNTHKDGVEIELDGKARNVLPGVTSKLEVGARVQLDPSGTAVWRVVPAADKERFLLAEATNVTWDMIGGAEEAKRAMREAIELPITHAALYAAYGKKPTKGVLLSGPPGCGKTMLAKAAATAVGGQAGAFFFVKGPELLNKWVGESEAGVRQLFEACRKHKAKTGHPAVLFIDEADALLGKRDAERGIAGMEKTIVPMFLAEMDGIEASGAIVILATNRPEALDSAIVREGRIDRKVAVRRPTRDEAEVIAGIHLKSVMLGAKVDKAYAAVAIADDLFDPKHVLYKCTLDDGASHDFTFANLVSGSTIAGVVEQAAAIAIQRDIDGGKSKPSGIHIKDLKDAVRQMVEQNRHVDHEQDIAAHVEPVRERLATFTKVKKAA